MKTLSKILAGTLIGGALLTGFVYKNSEVYKLKHTDGLVYPQAVQFENIQVVAETFGKNNSDRRRTILITPSHLSEKDTFSSVRGEDMGTGNFDTIKLKNVPRGSVIEQYATREKLEQAYSAWTNALAQKR